jgi:hypothetical protein
MERSNPFFAALSLPLNAKLPLFVILLVKFADLYSLRRVHLTAAESSRF